ncbi:MAG TPA: M48 family metallopeptidase [Gemmatimonadaceae bacterium]|nr:M48 family metallopeptidase [Gemmatimonadaceae bacterium]
MPDRRPLTGIASTAWEHPADRAALNAARALPGFDEVVRKVVGFFGDRGIRQLFLANAVRVGPTQRPKLHALYTEVLRTLDSPTVPELYVTQTPFVNAAAIGLERPFIIVNSGALELLDDEERRFILAHELGHVMSGHTTYTTIALILMTIGISNLPFLAGIALMPFQLALFEWYRKAEFSADRAGLLGTQDLETSMRVFLKFAGGRDADAMDLDAFMTQAAEYETGGNAWDLVLKVLNTAFRDHPFATVRAAELKRWFDSGDYGRILDGEYPGRDGAQPPPPLSEDVADAAGYYGEAARRAADTLAGTLRRASDAFSDAMKKR